MTFRKDGLFAILSTLCLTTLLLMVIPSMSGVGDYDPWLDTNDDGKIDMKDIAVTARAFGTSGTPINKTEVLLELQSKLNELEARVAALEMPIGLIITTVTNNTVMRIDLDGNMFWNVNIGSLTQMQDACWNPNDGSIYVLSVNNLNRLYSNGTIMWTIDISSMYVPGVGGPWVMDIDPHDGSAYVVAGGGLGSPFGLYKYDSSGTFLWYIPCGSNDLQTVVVNPIDGSVYTHGYVTGVFKYYPNGTMIWHTPLSGSNPYGSRSIAVDPSDGSVVAVTRYGGPATKIDANGNIVWQTFFTSDKSVVKIDPYRISVYVKGDGYLHKLDLTNGNVIWARSVPSGSSSDTAVTTAVNCRDGGVYFGGYDCNLTRVDPYDGSTIWSRRLGYVVGDITFETRFVPFD